MSLLLKVLAFFTLEEMSVSESSSQTLECNCSESVLLSLCVSVSINISLRQFDGFVCQSKDRYV